MFAVTEPRLKLLDVSHPYSYMPVSFLIPSPHSTVNVFAVFESFQISVGLRLNYFSKLLTHLLI